MANTRGRPRKDNVHVHLHLPMDLIQALKRQRPTLLKPDSQDFRHGALAAHVTSLLWKDLRQQSGPSHFAPPPESGEEQMV